jgi:DNA-binding helix-hairpin-helix protein with protein kinase domain
MPIERAIAEFRFPYGKFAARFQMRPPPFSLLLDQIPSAVQDSFERAFSAEAACGTARPTAIEWLDRLGHLQSSLAKCNRNKIHAYFAGLSSCPWCKIEGEGIILFIDIGAAPTPGLDIDLLWRILEALPPLGGMAPIPSLQNRPFPTVVPSEIIQRGKNRRIRMWIGAATVAVAVFLDAILRLDGASSIFLVMTAIAIAFLLPRKLNKQRATAATLVRESEGRYEALQRKYAAECGDQPFVTRVRSLESLRAEYTSLPLLRRRMLQELEKNKYGIQMQQYLDTFSIRTARILKVGDGRKQMLISYRVDTAADVTWKSLESVPGIGPKIARSIMEWRKGLEGKFRFDPQKAVGQLEIEKINREIRSRQSRLEQSINSGFREAMAVHAAISNKRKEYLNDLEQAVKHIAQARSNYRAS